MILTKYFMTVSRLCHPLYGQSCGSDCCPSVRLPALYPAPRPAPPRATTFRRARAARRAAPGFPVHTELQKLNLGS